MKYAKVFTSFVSITCVLTHAAVGAEVTLVPLGASGTHSILGNEITLDGGGQRVFLEIRISGWAPDELSAYQVELDSAGYSSGALGSLVPAEEPCTIDDQCEAALGPSATCSVTSGMGLICTAGFAEQGRPDDPFACCTSVTLPPDLATLNYRYGAFIIGGSAPDPGTETYGGSLVLDVPSAAVGTFVVGFSAGGTSLLDPNGLLIQSVALVPARITINCVTDADCDDGNACTDDTCQSDGTCRNLENFDDTRFCCDPTDGNLTEVDDGNDCTIDTCNVDGSVDHAGAASGTACGDPTETDCDHADSCLAGVCRSNLEPLGALCGDPSGTECTAPDSCDGAGVCLPNDVSAGALCGDSTDTICDSPDACDGLGACASQFEPTGTLCVDAVFCNGAEMCDGLGSCALGVDPCTVFCDEENGRCVDCEIDEDCINGDVCDGDESCVDGSCIAGVPLDCDDGIGCTDDFCDEDADDCFSVANDANCDNGAFCDGLEVCDEVLGCIIVDGSVPNCDDGIDCTEDFCDDINDVCVNSPNDGACVDDGLFCNGAETCIPGVGCDHADSPCGGPCDEDLDVCLCEPPLVEGVGARYLRVYLQPVDGLNPQGIVIEPDCAEGEASYVGLPVPFDFTQDGFADANLAKLVRNPAQAAFLTPAEWGELYVIGEDIIPSTSYVVRGDCGTPGDPGLSDPTQTTTQNMGDVVGTYSLQDGWSPPDGGFVNIVDVLAVIETFRHLPFPKIPEVYRADQTGQSVEGIGCLVDQQALIIWDVVVTIEAFRGLKYGPVTRCPAPCSE